MQYFSMITPFFPQLPHMTPAYCRVQTVSSNSGGYWYSESLTFAPSSSSWPQPSSSSYPWLLISSTSSQLHPFQSISYFHSRTCWWSWLSCYKCCSWVSCWSHGRGPVSWWRHTCWALCRHRRGFVRLKDRRIRAWRWCTMDIR